MKRRKPLTRNARLKAGKPPKRGQPPKRKTPLKARGKRGSRYPKLRVPAYLAWIREQSCALVGRRVTIRDGWAPWHNCGWPETVEAAHVTSRGAGGADLGNVIPICVGSHRWQHDLGLKEWAQRYGLTVAEVRQLAQEYLVRYEREQAAPPRAAGADE